MGKELPAKHYTGKGYLLPGKFEIYKPLYKEICSLLPPSNECPQIVDLGCGVGFFAKVIYEAGYKKYLGLDFSNAILKHAKESVPEYEYKLINLYSKDAKDIFNKNTLFTAIETLEHINDDIKVLKSLPKDSIIIGSVPNKMSVGHVRVFKGKDDVVKRYSNIIEFDFLKEITMKPKMSLISIFRGKIK